MVVAIAGGTGDVGRTIVDQLVRSGKDFIVPSQPSTSGPSFVAINYDDIQEASKTLEAYNVDTILSALNIEGPSEQSQLNLIAAADLSQVTRRFIPSDFAGYAPLGETVEDAMTGPGLRAAKALAKTELVFTRVASGMFMDYFGLPNIPSHLRPFQWGLNVPARKAAIPGNGNEQFSVTYSKDLARFLDRLLDETSWPEWSIISGTDTCMNELVSLAEKATGDKFDVVYDSVEDLQKGKATLVFEDGASYGGIDSALIAAMSGLIIVQNKMLLPKDGRLNQKFPDIQPISVESFMAEAWAKKQG
ncbi:hypothetical protein CGLO_13637 [Colletotrichum gloeosporioides Cg-14]|uniref:Uncharacterized protein n=1 Tax=Colletotrichum gloeosporioides (strain Cg-14) TaxID=1237896 RepID=T0K5Q5_COLGC|nr:hypothetical protein CGLO_13637 [Colletotrichum gloeosporioides Cg-14]